MSGVEIIGAVVALSLILTELALVVSINRAVKEIRGLRRDLPAMLGLVAGMALLSEAAKRIFPPKKSE